MYPNCMSDIMILAQAVLQIFCSNGCFSTQYANIREGRYFSQILTTFYQKSIRSSTPWGTIYTPNIMILAQAVLHIFCSQGSIGLQCKSGKRAIIQPNIYRILPKVNQVIYTLDTICEPNMILTLAVLQIFCSQGVIGLQCKSRKWDITAMTSPTEKKTKYGSSYFSCTFHVFHFKSYL